jgi:hypothetical protein
MSNTLRSLFVSATLAAAAATAGCGGSTMGTPDGGPPPGDMAMPMNVCASSTFCTTSAVADQTLDLNVQDPNGPLMIPIVANSGYSGMVNVTVQRTAIDALSGGADPDVLINPVPSGFQLTGGTPYMLTVHLGTSTQAAAFAAQPVTLHLQDAADASKTFDIKFNLTVTNILLITFTGDGVNTKHAWSIDGTTGKFNVRQRAVVAGVGGTEFRFYPTDPNIHTIHGNGGPIPHQGIPAQLKGGTGVPTYVLKNVNSTMAITGGFYCHDHGANSEQVLPGVDRIVTFIP